MQRFILLFKDLCWVMQVGHVTAFIYSLYACLYLFKIVFRSLQNIAESVLELYTYCLDNICILLGIKYGLYILFPRWIFIRILLRSVWCFLLPLYVYGYPMYTLRYLGLFYRFIARVVGRHDNCVLSSNKERKSAVLGIMQCYAI